MNTKKMELDFKGIPQPVQGPLAAFSSDLDEKLGQNLASITVVGSCLGEDYRPGLSDINTVLVLDRLDQGVLKAVASEAKGMHKKGVGKPEWVFKRVTNGFRKMPAWRYVFTREERMAVTAFVMSKKFSP